MSHCQSEYQLSTLLYIARLIAEQDYDEVLNLGLRREQLEQIGSMTTADIQEVSRYSRANFLEIRLDPDALDLALAALNRHKSDESLNQQLIAAGERYPMMHEFCGMNTEEYAKHRRFLGLSDGRGRPPVPSDATQAAIWRAWQDSEIETNPKRRYLMVYEKTQVCVGTIWQLIRDWESTGGPPNTARSENRKPVSSDQVLV